MVAIDPDARIANGANIGSLRLPRCASTGDQISRLSRAVSGFWKFSRRLDFGEAAFGSVPAVKQIMDSSGPVSTAPFAIRQLVTNRENRISWMRTDLVRRSAKLATSMSAPSLAEQCYVDLALNCARKL
jgi:hypothetical protein